MKKNVGNADKIVRIILGLVLGYLYFSHTVTGTWGIVALIAGLVMLGTALAGFCPLYTLLHVNTGSKEH